MLILTRMTGETVTIGHDVRIRVLAVKGAQVRLGIEAPDGVRIMREEIADATRTPDAGTECPS